jgi:hypothetical protein
MLKWLGRVVLAVVALLMLALLAVQGLRWTALGEHERAALALASVPPPAPEGRSGFAWLAMSDYDLPLEAVEAEMAAEVRDYTAWLEAQGDLLPGASGDMASDGAGAASETWTPSVARRYPAREPLTHDSPLCPLSGANCLSLARADDGAMRKRLASESGRLALLDRALAADHLRNPYPPSHQAPFPPLNALRLPLTQAAMDAVDGRVPEAMSRTCRILASSRRFSADARDLVSKMFFPAISNGAATMLLELRREHPGVPLPDECGPALEPLQADDYLICEGMRGEFRMGTELTGRQDRALEGRWTPKALFVRWVLVDSQLQDAWMATSLAAPCTDDYRAQVLAGDVPPIPGMPVSRDHLHCYAATISCLLAEVALPAYGGYQGRLLDQAAKLRVTLAAHAAVGAPVDAEALQMAAASPGYSVTVDAAARTISMRLRFQGGKAANEFSAAY